MFSVLEYGASGAGQTLDTAAIQAAIQACSEAGGGTVYFPAGAYASGALFLRSHVTLCLDAGAILLGSEDPADYPIVAGRWEGAEQLTHAPLLGGAQLANVAIVGRGTVDGRGAVWWKRHHARTLQHPRPRAIAFTECTNVLVEGITIANSPSWTINPVGCENVTVDRVTIVNPADSPNTDGINPDSCRNVHIANCHLDVGDDCITIKSGTEHGDRSRQAPCENITITNCTMVHGHGGVVIGSEMSGGVRNVVISNCVFTGTDRGIRLKSRRGRGGVVEDIRASNIVMVDVLCPFSMNLHYACGAWGDKTVSDTGPRAVSDQTPRFRHIHLSQITARQAHYAAGYLHGLAEMPAEDVCLSDVAISMAPDAAAGYPDMADDMELLGRAGLIARHVRGLRLHNVEISGQLGPAVYLADAADVEIESTGTPTPPADGPVIRLRDVEGAFVHGCQARAGTAVFLQVQGARSREIVLAGNNLGRARQALQIGADVDAGAVS